MKLWKGIKNNKFIFSIQIILLLLIGYLIFYMSEGIMIFILILAENAIIATIVALYINKTNDDIFSEEENKLITAIDEIGDGLSEVKFNYDSGDRLENIYKSLEKMLTGVKDHERMREEVLKLVNTAASNVELSKMLTDLIPKLAAAADSEWGAFYQANDITNKLELKYSMGFSKNIYNEFDISIGEGFIGIAALSKTAHIINNVPEDTIFATRTVLGKIWPRNLMFVPILNQEQLLGVIVLGSVYEYTNYNKDLMNFVNYYLGLAIGNGITYERTRRLTNELQFQNKLIQSMNEELEYKVKERTTFLNCVIDSIQDYAIYAIDRNGYINSWNKKAETLFGYSAEEVIGEPISDFFLNDELSAEKLDQRLQIVKSRGRFEEKSWMLRKDCSKCFLHTVHSPLYDERDDFIGVTCISKETLSE